MHPEDIDTLDKATLGEKVVFKFLRILKLLSSSERFPVS
jgi:hypothetical protein